jgi:hypothetical protein
LVLAFRGLWLIKDRAWGVLLKETALFACFPLVATAFRYEYYGDVVPNTYYLKLTGLDRTIRLQAGWAYTRQLLPSLIPVLGLALLGLVLRFNMRKLLLGALVASELAYQTWVGGDAWLYWRFFCPYFPLLAVLAVEGAALALEMVAGALPRLGVEGVQRQWRLLAAAALLPVAVALAVADGAFAKELLMQENPMSVDYNRTNMHIGLSLKRTLKPGAKVGVTWAGVIPFFSGHIGVDFLGKCDKVIAHRDAGMIGFNGMATVPGHNKYDLHYSIEQLKPDYIQTHFWGGDDLLPYVEKNYVRRENNLFRIDSPYVNWEAFMDGLPRPALPKPELPKPRGPKSKR